MPDPSPRSASLALAAGGLSCLAGAMGIGRFLYTPILPLMVEALGLSKTQAGLLASANFVGYLAGALLAAAQRLPGSARAQLLAGLALGAATTFAMGLTASFGLFLALRFAGGLASAIVLVCASSLVLERLARQGRPGLSSLHFAGVGLGIVISALLVLAAPPLGGGWRALWLAGGAVHALALVLAAWLITPAAPAPAAAAASTGPGRMPIPLVLAYGLFGFGYVTTATFLVAIVRSDPATRPYEAAIWMAVGLAGMISVAAWSALARRMGLLRAFAAACLAEGVGVLASVGPLGLGGLLLAAVLLGGTFMAITALGLVAARTYAPHAPRRILGLMTASFGVGQIVGPLVAGAGYDWTGSFVLPSLAAALLLGVAAGLAWVLPPPASTSIPVPAPTPAPGRR
ncbi:MAG: YbfB/YjiJ family MFS transporter [Alsobacter sp.]